MSAHSVVPKPAIRLAFTGLIILFIALAYELQNWGMVDLGLPTEAVRFVDTYYKVIKVTDGDTLHIDYNGTDEKVRLIGINTPETTDPRKEVECFGKEASDRMKGLVEGKIVRIEYDESQNLRDAYNRLLAYVYLEDGEMINRKMIAEGYAYEYTYMTPYKYQSEFKQVQNIARTSERGLWSPSTCNGKK